MTRAFNFCAGPAALPEVVLQQAQRDLVDWQGRGCSIMEMSHRGADFVAIAEQAEQDLRDLLTIPNNYKVLFLQGGATQQFAQVPVNLLAGKASADYVCTGVWSEKAIAEARKFAKVNIVATDVTNSFRAVPAFADWQLDSNAAYLHYTPNETIHGVEYDFIPQVDVPLVADYSSSILSEPFDVSKFGLIYAGAQKNIGPAGIVVVIVREDLLGHMMPNMPTVFDYSVAAKNGSMYNTPPTYAWYLSGLVFQWLKAQGGLEAIATLNARKAAKLYGAIDASDFYANPVALANRSRMNVPFTLADAALDKVFLEEAEALQLLNLAGHRLVGGMRASLYNAVPEVAVDALITFMADFERRHG
jgi:phosphoserine aminotransferase